MLEWEYRTISLSDLPLNLGARCPQRGGRGRVGADHDNEQQHRLPEAAAPETFVAHITRDHSEPDHEVIGSYSISVAPTVI